MWPWEHLAVGYICYSLYVRLRFRRAPGDWPVLLLAFGTMLPDLIDKPLAWGLDVLPHGRSLGHSLFLAIPVTAMTWYARGRRAGTAIAVGFGSHLLTDAIHYWAIKGTLDYNYLFWPLVERPAVETPGIFLYTDKLFVQFVEYLHSPVGQFYLLFEGLLLFGALALWLADGRPGLPPFLPDDRTVSSSDD